MLPSFFDNVYDLRYHREFPANSPASARLALAQGHRHLLVEPLLISERDGKTRFFIAPVPSLVKALKPLLSSSEALCSLPNPNDLVCVEEVLRWSGLECLWIAYAPFFPQEPFRKAWERLGAFGQAGLYQEGDVPFYPPGTARFFHVPAS